MNRQRKLAGVNSYEKDLGLNIGPYLRQVAAQKKAEPVRWLDLCCGEGHALIEFAQSIAESGDAEKFSLTGIDLVGMFAPANGLEIEWHAAAFEDFSPNADFDLITCVHGLHYFGDKLGTLKKIGAMLAPNGYFRGNISSENIRDLQQNPISSRELNEAGAHCWHYNGRKRLIEIQGYQEIPVSWEFVGADDQAGPNYTGQEVVHSYYL